LNTLRGAVEVAAAAPVVAGVSAGAAVTAMVALAAAATSNCLEEGVMRDVNRRGAKGFASKKVFSGHGL
jgi:hypothetical protein